MIRRVSRRSFSVTHRIAPALFVATFAACGGNEPSEVGLRAVPLACGEEQVVVGGAATRVGCGFEQQGFNIFENGEALSPEVRLLSAGTAVAVQLEQKCKEWVLGTDQSGQTIIISTTSGEVRWHGLRHPGQAFTVLPDKLPLPVELR